METSKPRDYFFDNLKFILIVLVVVGHVLEPLCSVSRTANTMYNFIYFFHIPLFVFVTGHFSKKLDKLGHLVALYVVFETLYAIFDFYVNRRTEFNITFFTPYWVNWYLLAVVLWKIILPYFTRLRFPVLIAVVIAVLAGYTSSELGYFLSIMRAVNFFPFFLAGYYMNRESLNVLFRRSVTIVSAITAAVTYTVLYAYGQELKCEWLWGSYSYEAIGHPEWYAGVYRIAVFLVTVILSAAVLSLTPAGKTRVSELGTRTMYPFLLHGFLLKYAIAQGLYKYIDTSLELWLLVAAAVAATILLSMKWIAAGFVWLFRPNLSFLVKKRDPASGHVQT
ncbi:fucose 4-O-acetylase [Cohnella pontilimi]|uniref:Fucose 4-O-acetylase n=1 Tax=Cohnella pontilimi TaxID=2564100 RepID=A0A4U0F8Q6_9BACL|nr:acyltransferase family protein [Cohnella pontilimi]TJY41126.1 fucose 4-O-acetylase [Cohnella pontilimi]